MANSKSYRLRFGRFSLLTLSASAGAIGIAAALRVQELTGRGWFGHVPPTVGLAILTVLLLVGLFMMLNTRD